MSLNRPDSIRRVSIIYGHFMIHESKFWVRIVLENSCEMRSEFLCLAGLIFRNNFDRFVNEHRFGRFDWMNMILINGNGYSTYIEPLGTVMFSPSRIIFWLRFGPYALWARRTQTACCRLVATVDGCEINCRRFAAKSNFGDVEAPASMVTSRPDGLVDVDAGSSTTDMVAVDVDADVDVEPFRSFSVTKPSLTALILVSETGRGKKTENVIFSSKWIHWWAMPHLIINGADPSQRFF